MMSNLQEIIDMWKTDCIVDETEPGKEILRIPVLHSKYTAFLSNHSLASKQCSFEYSRMKRLKIDYFSGRMDQEDLKKYGWEPFKFILKTDINYYLEADQDLQKIQAKKILHDNAAEYCTMVAKELNNRTFQIRAFMDWEKFIHGQR